MRFTASRNLERRHLLAYDEVPEHLGEKERRGEARGRTDGTLRGLCSPGRVAPPMLLRKSSHNPRQATMCLSFLPRVNAGAGGARPQGRGLSHRTGHVSSHHRSLNDTWRRRFKRTQRGDVQLRQDGSVSWRPPKVHDGPVGFMAWLSNWCLMLCRCYTAKGFRD